MQQECQVLFSPHNNHLGSNVSHLFYVKWQHSEKTKESFIAQLEHDVFGELKYF